MLEVARAGFQSGATTLEQTQRHNEQEYVIGRWLSLVKKKKPKAALKCSDSWICLTGNV